MSAALTVEDLHGWYGPSHVLQGVSFAVAAGSAMAILGRNGAGKTTLIKVIMGLLAKRRGVVRVGEHEVGRWAAHRIARAGLAYVPETRAIFPSLSVEENLTVAARPGRWTLERIYQRFPRLQERRHNAGNHLSGGEQQMLAIARALMTGGDVLLLDEPTEGLAPIMVDEITALLQALKADNMTMIVVEQNHKVATAVADHLLILGRGRRQWTGTPQDLAAAGEVTQTWLGV